MRPITMRQIVREMKSGKIQLSPEQEANTDRTVDLVEELSQILLPFMLAHSEVPPEAVGIALLQRAAIHMMASHEMSPDDVAVLTKEIAENFQDEARRLRQQVLSRPQA
jgi:hypothetical protein